MVCTQNYWTPTGTSTSTYRYVSAFCSSGILLQDCRLLTHRCVVLQQQHLIELIRLRETEAALEFAQSQLAEQGEESRECLTEMERTLALLAFDNPEESPFGDLLNMMQRQKVWSITRVGPWWVLN